MFIHSKMIHILIVVILLIHESLTSNDALCCSEKCDNCKQTVLRRTHSTILAGWKYNIVANTYPDHMLIDIVNEFDDNLVTFEQTDYHLKIIINDDKPITKLKEQEETPCLLECVKKNRYDKSCQSMCSDLLKYERMYSFYSQNEKDYNECKERLSKIVVKMRRHQIYYYVIPHEPLCYTDRVRHDIMKEMGFMVFTEDNVNGSLIIRMIHLKL